MRIAPLPLDAGFCEAEIRDLLDLVAQPDDRAVRPCPGCDLACPGCGSTHCRCNCRPDCPEAPRRLSSDPERFPIERGVVPLVYALATLRLLPACWSCEGHAGAGGDPRRLPSVWFFSRKLAYPGLVSELLSRLKGEGRLANDWQVSILTCGMETDWVFALEPRLDPAQPPDLASLRGDMAAIAVHLGKGVRALAAARIERLRRMLGGFR